MSAPVVSVIVPNYNHAIFLRERLDSILNQTFQDFELILLDDCSTDDSANVLDSYKEHPRVSSVVVNHTNTGSPCSQWKTGLEQARGHYVWIAESDDVADSSFLEVLLQTMSDYPDVMVAYSQSRRIDQDGQNLGVQDWTDDLDPVRWKSAFHNTCVDELTSFLRFRNTVPNASAALIRRDAFAGVIFPDDMLYAGDWFVWLQVLSRGGTVIYHPESLNLFRSHNATTRGSDRFIESDIRRVTEFIRCYESCSLNRSNTIADARLRWIIEEYESVRRRVANSGFRVPRLPLSLRKLHTKHYGHRVPGLRRRVIQRIKRLWNEK